MLKKIFLIIVFILSFTTKTNALSIEEKTPHVTLNVIPEYTKINSKIKTISVITQIDIKENWHIYWKNPGDTGDPTDLTFLDTPYYQEIETTRSLPKKSVFNDLITTYIHKNQLFTKTVFSLNNKETDSIPFHLILSYTVCNKECLPETIHVNFDIPLNKKSEINPDYFPVIMTAEDTFPTPIDIKADIINNLFHITLKDALLKDCTSPEFISNYQKKNLLADLPKTKAIKENTLQVSFNDDELPPDISGILLCQDRGYELKTKSSTPTSTPNQFNLLYYILTALIAGLILNLMPCVLPIISLKALYLATHKEKASLKSALIYLSGVLFSFLLLSGILFYLRSIGQQLGWGFQLQSPTFNFFLLILFFAIFLNLNDYYIISSSLADKLNKITTNKSFLTGFFAVLIACPCTGPFMGAALGYAMDKPALIYFTIFLSLGLGYALPYVLIEAKPKFFLKFIPKPGRWMITLKRILSIPIALTCLWLGWLIFNQLKPNLTTNDIQWEPYNQTKVNHALKNDEAVLIDFTAKWCLVCLLNDKNTLETKDFKALAQQKNIRLFKADWTNHDEKIAHALKLYNRNSIPLYVYYKKGNQNPIYLPQILTMDLLKNTL